MKIRRLELENFRTIEHLVLEDIGDTIVLVGANGTGKSSVLEAIAGAKEIAKPYTGDRYQHTGSWGGSSHPCWPSHLSEPVRIGARSARIEIVVEASSAERASLGLGDRTEGRASFTIEGGRYVTRLDLDGVSRELFDFHSTSEPVGYLEYIRPIRFYPPRTIGNFAGETDEHRLRQALADFQRPLHQQEKFSTVKPYIISQQLRDLSEQQMGRGTGDSLAGFRRVFDRFFAPKRFVGYYLGAAGESGVAVDTSAGSVDVDWLSDGEKEVLHVLAHLYRHRDRHNIVLWDTPEVHLNCSLEARLYDAIREVAPDNQYWLATHSVEVINSAPPLGLYAMRNSGDSVVVRRIEKDEPSEKITLFRELGASIGLQLVANLMVFVEGKGSHADKRHLERLLGPRLPGVAFVAAGSSVDIQLLAGRADSLLSSAIVNGDCLAVMDRDYRSDAEAGKLEAEYGKGLFIWQCHEFENLLLQDDLLLAAIRHCDQAHALSTPEDVGAALRQAAESLADWVAADWVRHKLHESMRPTGAKIGQDTPREDLHEYASRWRDKLTAVPNDAGVDAMLESTTKEVRELLAGDEWRNRLPGKEILNAFREQNGITLSSDEFAVQVVSIAAERQAIHAEILRLQAVLEERLNKLAGGG